MAIDFALQMDKEFGCKKVEIESDSVQAIHIARSEDECFLLKVLLTTFMLGNFYLTLYVSINQNRL